MRKKNAAGSLVLAGAILSTLLLPGCAGKSNNDGKTEVTMVQYKPEAVAAFEEMEERFNATHDDIHLTIESPNEAMTVLKTRFIREDYPDIIGIGGDINYSNFLDADMFLDVSDFEGVQDIKPAYMDIVDELEFIPKDGVYGLPYVANPVQQGYVRGKRLGDSHDLERIHGAVRADPERIGRVSAVPGI